LIQGSQPNLYFAGKLIQEQGHSVVTDRLGSVRWRDTGERSNYLPYGAEVAPPTSDQRTKFATYFRDSQGLDYAGQRYYSNVAGRFLTPDRGGSAHLKNPISWNRYVYASDDPINRVDPSGRDDCGADWLSDASLSGPCYEDGSGGGVVVPDPASLVMIWGAPTITTGERGAYERAMIALLAAAAAAGASASQGGLAYPAYLLVVGDSYTCWGHNVERDVDYQLYDSSNRPTDGTVTETLFATDYGAPVITRPALNQSWGGTNGTFNDTISVQYGPSRQYDQTFSVTGSSESLAGFAAIPVYVKGFGGDYGVLHITKTAQYVDINGNKGSPINCN
jgi:RHS repeat-associated protein